MKQTILLTGASGGLGHHIATALAKAGYNLALHYNEGKTKIETLLDELKEFNTQCKSYKADITSEQQVEAIIKNVHEDFGTIDVLINNAGVSINGISWNMDLAQWNQTLAVNLTGPFLCIKHVLPMMRKNNFGRIINISSVVAQIGVAGTVAYSASKAGLTGMTKAVAKEVVKNNITINTLSLGYYDAGILYQIPEELREKIKESIPKNEFGNPDEVVKGILYLCDANYITGQTININGGLY